MPFPRLSSRSTAITLLFLVVGTAVLLGKKENQEGNNLLGQIFGRRCCVAGEECGTPGRIVLPDCNSVPVNNVGEGGSCAATECCDGRNVQEVRNGCSEITNECNGSTCQKACGATPCCEDVFSACNEVPMDVEGCTEQHKPYNQQPVGAACGQPVCVHCAAPAVSYWNPNGEGPRCSPGTVTSCARGTNGKKNDPECIQGICVDLSASSSSSSSSICTQTYCQSGNTYQTSTYFALHRRADGNNALVTIASHTPDWEIVNDFGSTFHHVHSIYDLGDREFVGFDHMANLGAFYFVTGPNASVPNALYRLLLFNPGPAMPSGIQGIGNEIELIGSTNLSFEKMKLTVNGINGLKSPPAPFPPLPQPPYLGIYGVEGNTLYFINPDTGAGHEIGTIPGNPDIASIDYYPNYRGNQTCQNTLVALDRNGPKLLVINPENAAVLRTFPIQTKDRNGNSVPLTIGNSAAMAFGVTSDPPYVHLNLKPLIYSNSTVNGVDQYVEFASKVVHTQLQLSTELDFYAAAGEVVGMAPYGISNDSPPNHLLGCVTACPNNHNFVNACSSSSFSFPGGGSSTSRSSTSSSTNSSIFSPPSTSSISSNPPSTSRSSSLSSVQPSTSRSSSISSTTPSTSHSSTSSHSSSINPSSSSNPSSRSSSASSRSGFSSSTGPGDTNGDDAGEDSGDDDGDDSGDDSGDDNGDDTGDDDGDDSGDDDGDDAGDIDGTGGSSSSSSSIPLLCQFFPSMCSSSSSSGGPNSCDNDNDCPVGQECINGECVPECEEDFECPGSQVCTAGECVDPECNDDADCPFGEICIDNTCEEECSSDLECPDDEQCVNGICEPECDSSFDCPSNEQCINGSCIPRSSSSRIVIAQNSSAGQSCGNGIREGNEQCDDGNGNSNDGCTTSCTLDGRGCMSDDQCTTGRCINGSCFPCVTDDECMIGSCTDNICRVPSLVAAASVCGNGVLEGNEECDDSNTRDGDGCTSVCLAEIGICGDGKIQKLLGEQCEPSLHDPSNSYSCQNCRFVSPLCGNAKVDQGEECDLGAQNSTSPDALCRPDCSRPRCGDGIKDSLEMCDDGNRIDNDGCNRFCTGATAASQVAGANNPPLQIPFTLGVNWPSVPSTQTLPFQLPLAQLQPVIASQGPAGDTGPAAIMVVAAGAASGLAWIRRKRK